MSSASAASAILVFALSGLGVLVLVAAGAAWALRRQGTDEAIANARRTTEFAGRALIKPSLSDGLSSEDPAAVAVLDRVVREQILGNGIVRVKVWTPDGRILYSDESRLIGAQFALGSDEIAAVYSGHSAADVSDLSRPENRFETPGRKLLEVYYPVQTPNGSPLLFEAYLPFSSIASSGQQIWLSFLPAVVAGLVVLELVQLPLAWSMARRLRRGQRDRESLLRQAIESSDIERRRIADELHDSAVQDLAGQALALSASADRFAESAPPELVAAMRNAARATRISHQHLRSLLFDIYPPNLGTTGLKAAFCDLLSPLSAQGVSTKISVSGDEDVDARTRALLYRAGREALRNVLKHAGAGAVSVEVQCSEVSAVLSVEDDGRGFSPEEARTVRARGHVGLRVLEDLASSAGGTLVINSSPGSGTRIRLEVPR